MTWRTFSSWFAPRWDWLQVEVTTHCNAACVYCPRTVYRDSWVSRHLSLDTFRRLLPAFGRTRLVYLQGWGEPFVHPDFFTLVKMAKDAGCRVGTTTNGMLLDAEKIARLVDLEVDLVAFSLAGTDGQNDLWRRGTSLDRVLEVLGSLRAEKEKRGRTQPEVHLAYMLLRPELDALRRLPRMLQGLGVSQVVVSTLDLVAAPELRDAAILLPDDEAYRAVGAELEELGRRGRQDGLAIYWQLPRRTPVSPACRENAARALVVSAGGLVSPCVYANLPVAGAGRTHFYGDEEVPLRQLFFGDVNDQSLAAIWRRPAFRRFRDSLAGGPPPDPCRRCLKW